MKAEIERGWAETRTDQHERRPIRQWQWREASEEQEPIQKRFNIPRTLPSLVPSVIRLRSRIRPEGRGDEKRKGSKKDQNRALGENSVFVQLDPLGGLLGLHQQCIGPLRVVACIEFIGQKLKFYKICIFDWCVNDWRCHLLFQ